MYRVVLPLRSASSSAADLPVLPCTGVRSMRLTLCQTGDCTTRLRRQTSDLRRSQRDRGNALRCRPP